MKRQSASFTLVDLMVTFVIVVTLSAFMVSLFGLGRAREEGRRKVCMNNLGQIAKACVTYQEPNGDFWPCHWDANDLKGVEVVGSKGNVKNARAIKNGEPYNNPMQSLALLYPKWIDNAEVFRCPSTKDRPVIAYKYVKGSRHTGFGPDPDNDGLIEYQGKEYDPSAFAGREAALKEKCSYMYDPLVHFRNIGPGQAMAADADGYTWRLPGGRAPLYRKGWTRRPRGSNHRDFQNVMYFDSHVQGIAGNNYCSQEPKDNIFARNGSYDTEKKGARWGADTDAVLWDESNYPEFDPDKRRP